jgi:DNA polymerase III subunit beta
MDAEGQPPGVLAVLVSDSFTPEVGEAKESLPVMYQGREYSIAFNPEFLMAPLRNLSEEEIYLDLIDELSPGVIKIAGPFLYVLMPVRL